MAHSCLFTWKSYATLIYKENQRWHFRNGLKLHYAFLHKCVSLKQNQNVSEIQSGSESDSDSQDQYSYDPKDLKLKILSAALKFVPEYGWSKTSLSLGAKSLGLASSAHGMIEEGGADLVHHFNFSCNQKLDEILRDNFSDKKSNLSLFLETALKTRVKMVIPYVSKWPEAMALMMFPTQFPSETRNLLDLVDIIWYHSGDGSVDMTWYSKRLTLAAAYKACELSLVQDKSPDFSDTYDFLQRRIEMVVEASECANKINEGSKNFLDFGAGTFFTIRNLLGANRYFR